MKVLCILLVIFGLAAAKPYDFDDILKDEFATDEYKPVPTGDYKTDAPPTGDYKTDEYRPFPTGDYKTGVPPTGDYKTDEPPTDDYKPYPTGGPRPTGGRPHPTGRPNAFWDRFIHFLFVKSVHGVKPDEHPDVKYIKPGQELVSQLTNVRREIIKTMGPLMQIAKLMKEDFEDTMRRVHKAVEHNDIPEAEHAVGETFIAVNRRMAMLTVEAANKGLFDNVKNMPIGKEELKRHMEENLDNFQKHVRFILTNFNQYRVSDGLLDEPFVKFGIETAHVFARAVAQANKVSATSAHVYIDMINRIVSLSLDHNNHRIAVKSAGASVLSFVRRETKVAVALRRMYGPKQCVGPKPPKRH